MAYDISGTPKGFDPSRAYYPGPDPYGTRIGLTENKRLMRTPRQLPMTLAINRSGEFIAHADATHPSQCGKVGARTYKYFVRIEATNQSLTSDGFVMENAWVDEYFQNRYTRDGDTCRSCEDMAQEAVWHFNQLFATSNELKEVELRKIYVRIHGSDFSYIEAEWPLVTPR